MNKQFLMDILQVAISSTHLNEEIKSRAKSEYFKLQKESQSYHLAKEKSLLFVNEYNNLIKDDKAEITLDDENFLVTIVFSNYDLDSSKTKNTLTEKYLNDCIKNINFRYNPNPYYSSLY